MNYPSQIGPPCPAEYAAAPRGLRGGLVRLFFRIGEKRGIRLREGEFRQWIIALMSDLKKVSFNRVQYKIFNALKPIIILNFNKISLKSNRYNGM